MSRVRLPNRRPALTTRVKFRTAEGSTTNVIVSIGFDAQGVKEVFCDDIKVGSDSQAIVMDACILISRLLQHGESIRELSATMCAGPSVVGAIVNAAAKEHELWLAAEKC